MRVFPDVRNVTRPVLYHLGSGPGPDRWGHLSSSALEYPFGKAAWRYSDCMGKCDLLFPNRDHAAFIRSLYRYPEHCAADHQPQMILGLCQDKPPGFEEFEY